MRRSLGLLSVLACVAALAQPAERQEWQLAPQIPAGLELVYRGVIEEKSHNQGVTFTKKYHLDLRVIAIESKNEITELAFLTKLTEQAAGAKPDAPEPISLRLDTASLDAQGRLTGKSGSPRIVLDGPCSWENGFAFEAPAGKISAAKTWSVKEADRPERTFRAAGTEVIANTSCVKITSEQQSDDWDKPQANQTAWRRKETLWFSPRLGLTLRVERMLERREPTHKEPTFSLLTRYDLDSNLPYTGQFLDDRRRDVLQAKQFHEKLMELAKDPKTATPKAFESLTAAIDKYTKDHTIGTPYRDAIARVRAMAVAAAQGQLPKPDAEPEKPNRFAIGKPAPEFTVSEFGTTENVSLRNWKGKTVLMVFFQPNSTTMPEVFHQLHKLKDECAGQAYILVPLAMNDDAAEVKKAAKDLGLTMPVLSGKALRLSYEVDATPRFVIVDADGVVRSAHTGWGPETAPALLADLKKYALKASR